VIFPSPLFSRPDCPVFSGLLLSIRLSGPRSPRKPFRLGFLQNPPLVSEPLNLPHFQVFTLPLGPPQPLPPRVLAPAPFPRCWFLVDLRSPSFSIIATTASPTCSPPRATPSGVALILERDSLWYPARGQTSLVRLFRFLSPTCFSFRICPAIVIFRVSLFPPR